MRLLVFFLFFLVLCDGYSQFPLFQKFTIDDGLSQNTVTSIAQDRLGFIWLGTEYGLNRFDGHTFKSYQHVPGDSASLPFDFISKLLVDNEGRIWIGTAKGLCVYDYEKDSFKRMDLPAGTDDIGEIYQDDENNIWIGSRGGGLLAFDSVSGHFKDFKHDAGKDEIERFAHNTILAIDRLNEKELLIGTQGWGYKKFDITKKKFVLMNDDSLTYKMVVRDFLRISQNEILMSSRTGLIVLDNYGVIKKFYDSKNGLPKAPLCHFAQDQRGDVWITSFGGGIIRFNIKNGRFDVYDLKSIAKSENNNMYSVFTDKTGNLWTGSWAGGLYKLPARYDRFITYPSLRAGLSGGTVMTFGEIKQSDSSYLLLTGSYGGGLAVTKITSTKLADNFIHPELKDLTEASQYIDHLFVGEDNVWLGTYGYGVIGIPLDEFGDCCDRSRLMNAFMLTRIRDNPHTLESNLVTSVYEHERQLWVGTFNGGLTNIILDEEYGTYGSVKKITTHDGLLGNTVQYVVSCMDGTIMAGTDNGLNFIDPVSKEVTGEFLKGYYIICLAEDIEKNIWVGSARGLFRISGRKLTEVSDSGWPDRNINAIQDDGSGFLWISTNKGLIRLNKKDNSILTFDRSDGLQSNEYNYRSAIKLQNERIIFGGVKGFDVFNPVDFQINENPPRVAITGFRINGRNVIDSDFSGHPILQKNIVLTDKIALTHVEKLFAIDFSALEFTNPSKNKYAYMLEGFDEDWIFTDASMRSATYTNLDPGAYQFKVKAANNDGLWSDSPTVLKIDILPPFWRTWWAYMFYGFVLGSIVFVGWKSSIQRERLKNQWELEKLTVQKFKEVDDFKSNFFANISHEFRTPLTLIIGLSDRIKDSIKNPFEKELSAISLHSKTLLHLVNQMLDLSRVEAKQLKLSVSPILITHFLEPLVQSFSSLASQHRLFFESEFPTVPVHGFLDASFVEKIVNNLLSNAIKYNAPAGSVYFLAEVYWPWLEIKVNDTGHGIKAEDLSRIFDRFYRIDENTAIGTGLGLALTQELVRLHHGEIKVESEVGRGSTFTVRIPIDKSFYNSEEIALLGVARDANPNPTMRISIAPPDGIIHDDRILATTILSKEHPTVLIVEDHAELRQFIVEGIRNDYHVIEAGDGAKGFAKAFEIVPDLILTDWMMPVMDGFTLCKKIKRDDVTNHIPVIILTAKAGMESKLEGLSAEADDYLVKPFEMGELRMRIKNLIEQRKKLQKKYSREGLMQYSTVKVTSQHELFLERMRVAIEENLRNPNFSTEDLAAAVNMSRVQLHRKCTSLLGSPSGEIIRQYRLQRAADLLRQKAGNVSEVAFMVGFENLSHFSKAFREQFGKLPSEMIRP